MFKCTVKCYGCHYSHHQNTAYFLHGNGEILGESLPTNLTAHCHFCHEGIRTACVYLVPGWSTVSIDFMEAVVYLEKKNVYYKTAPNKPLHYYDMIGMGWT